MFQSIGYPVFIYGGCHVVGHSFDMGLGISHSYPCGYVFQHGDIVAAVTESIVSFRSMSKYASTLSIPVLLLLPRAMISANNGYQRIGSQ